MNGLVFAGKYTLRLFMYRCAAIFAVAIQSEARTTTTNQKNLNTNEAKATYSAYAELN